MKVLLNVLAILIFLPGLVFFLQGINVLPGSFMTGDPQWAVNGGIMMVLSMVMFLVANRRKSA